MIAGGEIERDHIVVVALGAGLVAEEDGVPVHGDPDAVVRADEHVVAAGAGDVERAGRVGDDVGLGGMEDRDEVDRPFIAGRDRPDRGLRSGGAGGLASGGGRERRRSTSLRSARGAPRPPHPAAGSRPPGRGLLLLIERRGVERSDDEPGPDAPVLRTARPRTCSRPLRPTMARGRISVDAHRGEGGSEPDDRAGALDLHPIEMPRPPRGGA